MYRGIINSQIKLKVSLKIQSEFDSATYTVTELLKDAIRLPKQAHHIPHILY